MVKRLRENRKNKKGFTLVELIVVIVIILVLAAVMVPSVLRYVDKANKANTKSDAATILVDIQAQVADTYADDGVAPTTVTSNGITVDKNATLLKEKVVPKMLLITKQMVMLFRSLFRMENTLYNGVRKRVGQK